MNIDDFCPCNDCKTKECGLMDGKECGKCNEFLEIKAIVENAASESNRIASLYNAIKANTYVCDICGEIIFPTIITSGDGGYDVMKTSIEIIDGTGNKAVCSHVCSDCAEKSIIKSMI